MAIFAWQRKRTNDASQSKAAETYSPSGELFPKDPSQRVTFHSNALANVQGVTDPFVQKKDPLRSWGVQEQPGDITGLNPSPPNRPQT